MTNVKAAFEPSDFLAKGGRGRTVSNYIKDQVIFSQGESADAVFYIQTGQVKVTVVSEQGKEAIVAALGPDEFAAREPWRDRRCAWARPRR